MANPTNISMFVDAQGKNVQHDPYDRVEYVLDLLSKGLLESGESVASYTITPRAEAVALGATISSGLWAPTQPTTTTIKFWLEVDPTFQTNAAFDGTGTIFGIEVSVTTNNSPARRRQRTCGIQVAQQ